MDTLPKSEGINSEYGLGLWYMKWGKVKAYGHGGATGRFTSAAFHLPSKSAEIIMLCNSNFAPEILDIVGEIAQIVPEP